MPQLFIWEPNPLGSNLSTINIIGGNCERGRLCLEHNTIKTEAVFRSNSIHTRILVNQVQSIIGGKTTLGWGETTLSWEETT